MKGIINRLSSFVKTRTIVKTVSAAGTKTRRPSFGRGRKGGPDSAEEGAVLPTGESLFSEV